MTRPCIWFWPTLIMYKGRCQFFPFDCTHMDAMLQAAIMHRLLGHNTSASVLCLRKIFTLSSVRSRRSLQSTPLTLLFYCPPCLMSMRASTRVRVLSCNFETQQWPRTQVRQGAWQLPYIHARARASADAHPCATQAFTSQTTSLNVKIC